ncbi:MAG TPA: sugar phosphate isomerase/epimerase [Candidatus Hydrogenedentes bacterium]|nr:sugar phosphate isomerase/epimerase [Candidatus Hydrogenedentota bacterium]HPX86187.1 sugar phosphate isomerase/epimerase [Candidatus Hydrogenedentota bacterium]
MDHSSFSLSRRQFIGGAAALSAAALSLHALPASAEKPDSKFNGVQIGVITYSFRSLPCSAEELLGYITRCGISSVELMGDAAEDFAKRHTPDTGVGGPMDGFEALRKLYNEAGVNIHIVKFGHIGDEKMSDAEMDYYFAVAKALGARGITREMPDKSGLAERLGPVADRHEIMIGFHNHTQITPDSYTGDMLSYGRYLGINLDIGHYVAGTGEPAIPMIDKHRDRILSLHVKDRKKKKLFSDGPNMPFGEGDTQVAEVLQFLKQEGLTFPADIELEYDIPEGSDAVKEVTRCVQFCKEALA